MFTWPCGYCEVFVLACLSVFYRISSGPLKFSRFVYSRCSNIEKLFDPLSREENRRRRGDKALERCLVVYSVVGARAADLAFRFDEKLI